MTKTKEPTDEVLELFEQEDIKEEMERLEEAGLEEVNENDNHFKSGIFTYLEWFYDGELPDWD
jgi:hypothetical protein